MPIMQTRRQFLTALSLTSAAGMNNASGAFAQEDVLEMRSVRLARFGGLCLSPQYVVEDLLRADGFSDVSYVDIDKRRL